MGLNIADFPPHIREQIQKKIDESRGKRAPRQSHTPGQMNKWESQRASVLELKKRAGSILFWEFEKVTLVLAPGCRYTPDFHIVATDGTHIFEEVKGFWRDDALVKIKTAAQMFRWATFYSLSLKKGHWESRLFKAAP